MRPTRFAYPDEPGWKARDTSCEAARGVSSAALTLRERVLAAIKIAAGTPEELADRLDVPVLNVRPRCSELSAKGLIHDTGARRRAMGGRNAIVWGAA